MQEKTVINKRIRHNKTKVYFLIIILLISISLIILFKTDLFSVKSIIILNNYEISNEEIISYSGLIKDENIFKIKLSQIKEKLVKHPFVKHASIERNLPSEIIISIEERKKVAALSYMGIYFYIDEEGYILKSVPEVQDEIIIEGFEINSFVEGYKINIDHNAALDSAIVLSILFKQSGLEIIPKIHYENGMIELYINDGFKVKFGNGVNIEEKFNVFINIFNDLRDKNIYNGIIDLSHDGYPIYRPFGE